MGNFLQGFGRIAPIAEVETGFKRFFLEGQCGCKVALEPRDLAEVAKRGRDALLAPQFAAEGQALFKEPPRILEPEFVLRDTPEIDQRRRDGPLLGVRAP